MTMFTRKLSDMLPGDRYVIVSKAQHHIRNVDDVQINHVMCTDKTPRDVFTSPGIVKEYVHSNMTRQRAELSIVAMHGPDALKHYRVVKAEEVYVQTQRIS